MRIYLYSTILSLVVLSGCNSSDRATAANVSAWPETFEFGRTATQVEIDSIDHDIIPDGRGLPSGSGDVVSGGVLYQQKCANCHGVHGDDGGFNKLVGKFEPVDSLRKEKTIGSYWPYATTVYDYIHRAMPYNQPGSLTENEVYSITAFLLYKNGIIDSTIVLNATNLAAIEMPAKFLFVNDDRTGGPFIK
jgi:S-disulfanyl-L-cysteine oxidoreductase SoxD